MRRSLLPPPSSQSACVCERTPPPVLLPSALWPQCLAEQKRKQLNDGTVCPLAGAPSVWDERFGRRASLKKDTLLTQQVGHAAGCSGPRRGVVGGDVAVTQSQSSRVHGVICLGTEWLFQFLFR